MGRSYAGRREIAAALAGPARAARAALGDARPDAARHGRAGVSRAGGRPARCASRRASTRSTGRCAARGSGSRSSACSCSASGCSRDRSWPVRSPGPSCGSTAPARRVAEGDLAARAEVEGSSEQRSLARTFNEMTARLERLVRSQRDFVADASHQLRTPLTGLRLRVEAARSETGDPEAAADLDAALLELDRLAHMVDELLELSRAGEAGAGGERLELDALRPRRGRPLAAHRGGARPARERRRPTAPAAPPGSAWSTPTASSTRSSRTRSTTPPRGSAVEIAAIPGGLAVRDRGNGVAPGEQEQVFERFARGGAGRARRAGHGARPADRARARAALGRRHHAPAARGRRHGGRGRAAARALTFARSSPSRAYAASHAHPPHRPDGRARRRRAAPGRRRDHGRHGAHVAEHRAAVGAARRRRRARAGAHRDAHTGRCGGRPAQARGARASVAARAQARRPAQAGRHAASAADRGAHGRADRGSDRRSAEAGDDNGGGDDGSGRGRGRGRSGGGDDDD